jgi:tRNA (guanine-N7-)-methyltransferase
MRLRKKPWVAEAIKEYAAIIPEPHPAMNWRDVFGNGAPLRVELGIGRGKFICGMAQEYPGINFVGIEAQRDILFYAAQKVFDRQLANVRLLMFDAGRLTEVFAPGEVSRLYINFCDPWPKNRHAKRRLTHRRFLEKYRVILADGGDLFFKTDNEALFEFSLAEFTAAHLVLKTVTFDLERSGYEGNIMTEYEEKFRAKGQKIFRCEAVFVSAGREE